MWERLLKIDKTVRKTRDAWFGKVSDVFQRRVLDDSLYDELEDLLIQADVGAATTDHLIEALRERVRKSHITEAAPAESVLREEMAKVLQVGGREIYIRPRGELTSILIVGVNGSGKTTTIAKLADRYKRRNYKVALAAGDTFRAAAIDQLKVWGDRAGVEVIAHQPGSDSASVIFDAMQAGQRRGVDILIADTAGRLQTKFNLMEELRKVHRVMAKADPKAPTEALLVLDATTGQNALSQAKHFTDAVPLTGLIIAKLDGTAKGGAVFAIARELRLPIKFLGTGEAIDDLEQFDADAFVNALFGERELDGAR
ncbi:MAG: signal recognition particle-docking protein FtsY [Chloroflexi bacterium]|nr:signal recognition particle-docking protein FtsY [Chloroflexota bacterium]